MKDIIKISMLLIFGFGFAAGAQNKSMNMSDTTMRKSMKMPGASVQKKKTKTTPQFKASQKKATSMPGMNMKGGSMKGMKMPAKSGNTMPMTGMKKKSSSMKDMKMSKKNTGAMPKMNGGSMTGMDMPKKEGGMPGMNMEDTTMKSMDMHKKSDMNMSGMKMKGMKINPADTIKSTSSTLNDHLIHAGNRVNYDLYITDTIANYTGKPVKAMAINGHIPGPTIRFTEGDTAYIRVHNRMKTETSIHWHGVLVPNQFDGVPYLTTVPIQPDSTHTFIIPLRQTGTFWYHSHTKLDEQSGLYGSIVIQPLFVLRAIKLNHYFSI